jgi:hypothetical protein
MYDVKMADKANIFLRLDADGSQISVMIRNARNPANPDGVMEIVRAVEPLLEYPLKRVEMMLPIEYIEVF